MLRHGLPDTRPTTPPNAAFATIRLHRSRRHIATIEPVNLLPCMSLT